MPVGQRGSGAGGQSKYTSEEFISGADRTAAPQPRSPILVLVSPQDIVNIASAVRIAKNFGIERMRLVNPQVFDPYRIEGIAHNTADFVATIQIMESLEGAIADCVFTAVVPARGTGAQRAGVGAPGRGGRTGG